MKEINPFSIDANTKPSWESPEAKWYLIKKGDYSLWRWSSKMKNDDRYLVLYKNEVVKDTKQLASALTYIDLMEAVKDKE